MKRLLWFWTILALVSVLIILPSCEFQATGDLSAFQGASGNGTNGTNGIDGKTWWYNEGVPDGGMGVNGDFCLEVITYDIYVKILGSWQVMLNIKGIQGTQGVQGEQGLSGGGLESVSLNSTRWVIPGWYSGGSPSTPSIAINRTYYVPIYVSKNTTYKASAICVNGAIGSVKTLKFRIYEWDDGLPGAQVSGTTEISFSINAAAVYTDTTDIFLERGYYFIGYVCNAGVQMKGINNTCVTPVIGQYVSAGTYLTDVIMYLDDSTLDDPASLPTGSATAQFSIVWLQEN